MAGIQPTFVSAPVPLSRDRGATLKGGGGG